MPPKDTGQASAPPTTAATGAGGTGAAAAAATTEAEWTKILLSALNNTAGSTNWKAVADECGISTGGAVQKRIARMREKMGMPKGKNTAAADGDGDATENKDEPAAPAAAKKGRTKKGDDTTTTPTATLTKPDGSPTKKRRIAKAKAGDKATADDKSDA